MKVNPAHWRWAVDGCYRCMQDTSCTEGNIAAVEVRVLRWRVGIFLGGRRAMIDQDNIYMAREQHQNAYLAVLVLYHEP